MKTKFENTPGLREEGKFIFDVDGGFADGVVVRVDGVVVHPRADGRYELSARPRSLSSIVVEKCAGPFYAPRARYLFGLAALRHTQRRMLEAFVKLGGSSELPKEAGEILASIPLTREEDIAVFERFVDPELEAFYEAAFGPAPAPHGTATVTAITIPSLLDNAPVQRAVARKVPTGAAK